MPRWTILLATMSLLGAAEPALLGLGGGVYDIDVFSPEDWGHDDRNNQHAATAMVEYRPAWDLLGRTGDGLAVRCLAGFQYSEEGATATYAGLWVDAASGPVFAGASFGPALWTRGDAKDLGSALEFRTMVEAGWRSAGGLRLAATCSHLSNGGLADANPGANTLGVMLFLPL